MAQERGELPAALHRLKRRAVVVLGGGGGWDASFLALRGFEVASFDLLQRATRQASALAAKRSVAALVHAYALDVLALPRSPTRPVLIVNTGVFANAKAGGKLAKYQELTRSISAKGTWFFLHVIAEEKLAPAQRENGKLDRLLPVATKKPVWDSFARYFEMVSTRLARYRIRRPKPAHNQPKFEMLPSWRFLMKGKL